MCFVNNSYGEKSRWTVPLTCSEFETRFISEKIRRIMRQVNPLVPGKFVFEFFAQIRSTGVFYY
jgi:hypothetical protein